MSSIRVCGDEFWEIYDPDNCKVIAHVFDEKIATHFAAWLNSWRALGQDLL